MEKEIAKKELEDVNKTNEIAQRIAQNAGENTRTYTTMPTLTIYNPSSNNSDSQFEIGDFIKSVKTAMGYTNEKYDKPFKGIIVKVRMFLRLKYKYAEGKPGIITNEFTSYNDDELIIVKQQDKDGKYQNVFLGNYKQVNNKYSLKSDTEIEKKLDLHHSIYVLTDLDSHNIVRIDSKGVSRSNFFDYMNNFTKQNGDFMSTTITEFSSEISNETYNGKPRKTPIAAFSFTKKEKLSLKQLEKLEKVQNEFNEQLEKVDTMFGNSTKNKFPSVNSANKKDDIPVIQLDDEAKTLDKEEDEIKISDIPF